ncbi:methylmalonyl-CoA epimerase [Ammoniphilus oxalaticus]|uniref:Methylmalonyl-CoA epimerase n=1 Tax=Ammoniphilus oxalaticus TaxID=66863 RepID=A0A419SMX0_9BACL|nr:methylmalonyl-CoA epimerase [Ammoniphilus oxalaticus]RKD25625.1 methylmalonyl-CoA epimerase [Ammoniphilus oxalaticus]
MKRDGPKKIAHIGIAVSNLREAVHLYTTVLGFTLEGYETVDSEKVRIAFLKIGETRLELLEATSPDSPIARFIERRGEGIHHLAFQVDSLSERLRALQEQGINLIDPTPKQGADGNQIAFLHPSSTRGVLIELCESFQMRSEFEN